MAINTRIRAEEAYYNMQNITDKLYAQSKNGNNFYKLYELIIREENIMLAYRNIKKNTGSKTKGTDGKTIQDYKDIEAEQLVDIVRKRLNNYQPNSVRRVNIPKTNGKIRPLGIPTIEDRLIQQSIKQILEPICEAKFHPHSYGFRPLRSTKHAISRMMTLAQLRNYHYCVDIDIEGFFDNISHSKLIKQIWTLGIRDKRVISIISKMLKSEIVGEGIKDKGTPQGGILSPLLSNIVLNELDWWISTQYETINMGSLSKESTATLKSKSNLKQIFIIRYADDFKIMCKTSKDAKKIYEATKSWLTERLGLNISKEKSKIVNLRKQYSEFLGFKLKLIPRGNKYVIKSHMSDKAKVNSIEMLRRTIRKFNTENIDKGKLLNQLNSQIMGLHQYYNAATMVNHDFSDIAYNLKYLTERQLKNIAKAGKFKSSSSKYITDNYLKKNNYKTYRIGNIVLIPMVYISHKKVMNFSQSMTVYTEAGRSSAGYKKLIMATSIRERWKLRNRYDSAELLDNSISTISAQMMKCGITGLFIEDGEIHHIKPKEFKGTDEYENLIYIHKYIHKLIHMVERDKMEKYLSFFKNIKTKKSYNKILDNINEYRTKANMELITA